MDINTMLFFIKFNIENTNNARVDAITTANCTIKTIAINDNENTELNIDSSLC